MEIKEETIDGVVALSPEGDLDMYNAPILVARLNELRRPGLQLVIRLSGVASVDSTGLAALLAMRERLDRDGGRLLLAEPGRRMLAVLRITHTESSFELYDTLQEALQRASNL
jgi:anti-sigma B factor antagonist